jgi:hypothetical protein
MKNVLFSLTALLALLLVANTQARSEYYYEPAAEWDETYSGPYSDDSDYDYGYTYRGGPVEAAVDTAGNIADDALQGAGNIVGSVLGGRFLP